MRASHPVTYLLALAMAALLLLTTRSALAQSKPIPLPLTFNEVPKGDVAAVLQGDDIFLNPVDLEGLGVTGPMSIHFEYPPFERAEPLPDAERRRVCAAAMIKDVQVLKAMMAKHHIA